VNSLVFSENGFYFATGSSQQGTVNIWDLRKLSIVQTLLQNEADHFKFSCMEFDGSGQFLTIGSVAGTIKVFNTKTWESFTKFESHKDSVTSIRYFFLNFLINLI
jgi:WD40 repeat protein